MVCNILDCGLVVCFVSLVGSVSMLLVKVEARSWVTCVGCGETVRTCEKFLQVTRENGRPVRGERYCLRCEDIARENNIDDTPRGGCSEDGDLALREEYAAYQAAGATHAFWGDLDAGYVRRR